MLQLLIIDDDDLIRRALTSLLGRAYDVHCFPCALEALQFLRSGARPFLILVDAAMEGLSGHDFRAEQLRDGSLAHIPAVLMTGDDLAAEPPLVAFDAMIAKPFSGDELLPLLQRFAARHRPQAPCSNR